MIPRARPRAETTRSASRENLANVTVMELVTLLLDASPLPALVVDRDDEIIAINAAGRDALQRFSLADLRTEAVITDGAGPMRILRRGLESYEILIAQPVAIEASELFAVAVEHWSPTPRQREVLRGLIDGMSNKEIAKLSGCSHRTVEIHVTALLQKASVDTRARLVAKAQALAAGIRPTPSPTSDTVLRR